MSHRALRISVALLAFTAAFLTADSYENLVLALPLALFVFTSVSLCEMYLVPALDSHRLKVAALTLLLWIPLFAVFLQLVPPPVSCVPEFIEENPATSSAVDEEEHAIAAEEGDDYKATGITIFSCGGAEVYPSDIKSVWVGVVNKKAVAKPAPFYPPDAKSAHAEGTVAVSVLIDEAGMVVSAQALSGPLSLRQSAMDAACYARFAPTLASGPPVRASGVLTYEFVLK